MENMFNVEVHVLEDSPSTFGGELLYRKGETYHGVLDNDTGLALIAFRFGNQIVDIHPDVEFFSFTIKEPFEDNNNSRTKSIREYLKSISLNKWVQENVKDKRVVFAITTNTNIQIDNDVKGYGGSHYFPSMLTYIAVSSGDDNLILQSRKGAVFYIKKDNDVFHKTELQIEDLTYDNLKEVKYLIENDYKDGSLNNGK